MKHSQLPLIELMMPPSSENEYDAFLRMVKRKMAEVFEERFDVKNSEVHYGGEVIRIIGYKLTKGQNHYDLGIVD